MSETPRRNRMDKMTPAEAAIVKVISIVESAGASQDLTDAVVLLCRARDKVAAHVDAEIERQKPTKVYTVVYSLGYGDFPKGISEQIMATSAEAAEVIAVQKHGASSVISVFEGVLKDARKGRS